MRDKIIITFEAHGIKSEVSITDQSTLEEVFDVIRGQLIIIGYSHQTVFNDDDEDL